MQLHCIKFNKKSKRFFIFSITFFRHVSARKTVNEIKHAARVLSRYRDARRTRILCIRLRLTVRVKKAAGFYTCGFAEPKAA